MLIISNKAKEVNHTSPLYLYKYEQEVPEVPNFQSDFLKIINEKFNNPTPEEILAFIYASLHSPTYREKYLEFLKIDFPRSLTLMLV